MEHFTYEPDTTRTMKTLVGRTLLGATVSSNRKYLRLETDDGPRVYRADGDCCSYSWFEALVNQPKGTVESFEELPLNSYDGDPTKIAANDDQDWECLKSYTLRLATSEGPFDVLFWNDSNGYYGGYLERATQEDWDASEATKAPCTQVAIQES